MLNYLILDFLQTLLNAAESNSQIRDITPLPHFAFSPGLYAWLSFAVAAILCIGFLLRALVGPQRKHLANVFEEAIRVIEESAKTIAHADALRAKESLSRASLATKRLLSKFEPNDISSASEDELKRFLDISASEAFKDTCSVLIGIEKLKYQPSVEATQASKVISDLKLSVSNYRSVKMADKL